MPQPPFPKAFINRARALVYVFGLVFNILINVKPAILGGFMSLSQRKYFFVGHSVLILSAIQHSLTQASHSRLNLDNGLDIHLNFI
jgi:predicted transporter